MSFPLNNTENPITATERLKLNENWQRLSGYLFNLQYQINFLSGDADIDQILEDIEEAVTAANNAATNANSTIVEMNAALVQVQNVLDDANAIINDVANVLDDANEALENANEALDTANTAITGANAATDAANTATTNANTATTNANAATDAATTATTNANAATTAANNAATTATQLIGQMETLITQGNALVTSLNEFDWKGAYSASVTYRKNNFVQYNRSTYVALKQNLGITPNDNGVDWILAAGAGVDGQGAVNKVNGISPDADGNVTLLPNTTQEVNWLNTTKNATDLPLAYPIGITTVYVDISNGFPFTGNLQTIRSASHGVGTLQLLSSRNTTNVVHYRTFNSDNAWNSWSILESSEGAQAKVNAHANLTNNPHGVTSQQVNYLVAYSVAASAPATDLPVGITTLYVNTSNGYPTNGTLLNVRGFASNGAGAFQILSSTSENDTVMFTRRWILSTLTWTEFTSVPTGKDIDNIYSGSNNLISPFTKWEKGTPTANVSIDIPSENEVTISSPTSGYVMRYIDFILVEPNTYYTFSVEVKEATNATFLAREKSDTVNDSNNVVRVFGVTTGNNDYGTAPGVYKYTYKTRAKTKSIRIELGANATNSNPANVTIKNFRMNKGTVPSDWSPPIEVDMNFRKQSEYQTAQPNGTVLHLTKPSDSARIFFRLNIPVTGDIKISLDGGTTDAPLREFDGTQVNGIEAGFHEIVQGAGFFTLRNKGGVSQADLDALITAANEVEANSNVIRTDLINTINTAYPEGELSSSATFTQAIDMIPNIGSSKIRVQNGVFTASTTSTTFKARDGVTNLSLRYGQIDSLEFKPSRIELFSSSGANFYATNFAQSHGGVNDLILVSPHNQSILNNSSNYSVLLDGVNAYVTENSFRLPVNNSGGVYYWTAYE